MNATTYQENDLSQNGSTVREVSKEEFEQLMKAFVPPPDFEPERWELEEEIKQSLSDDQAPINVADAVVAGAAVVLEQPTQNIIETSEKALPNYDFVAQWERNTGIKVESYPLPRIDPDEWRAAALPQGQAEEKPSLQDIVLELYYQEQLGKLQAEVEQKEMAKIVDLMLDPETDMEDMWAMIGTYELDEKAQRADLEAMIAEAFEP